MKIVILFKWIRYSYLKTKSTNIECHCILSIVTSALYVGKLNIQISLYSSVALRFGSKLNATVLCENSSPTSL